MQPGGVSGFGKDDWCFIGIPVKIDHHQGKDLSALARAVCNFIDGVACLTTDS